MKLDNLAYFAGCTAAYRLPGISQSSVKLLNKLGLNFQIIGDKELCCGSILFNVGFIDEGIKLAHQNAALFKKMRIKTLITECAGCTKIFRNTYPEYLEFSYEVYHLTEIIEYYIKQNQIQVLSTPTSVKKRITYHDPCHLGRGLGIFSSPRSILNLLQNVEFIEMKPHSEMSRCCGAGGGVKANFPEIAGTLGIQRIIDAENVNAEIILTTCPFCILNLKDSASRINSSIEIQDFCEFILNYGCF